MNSPSSAKTAVFMSQWGGWSVLSTLLFSNAQAELTMLSLGFPQCSPCAPATFPPLTDLYLFVSLCLYRVF